MITVNVTRIALLAGTFLVSGCNTLAPTTSLDVPLAPQFRNAADFSSLRSVPAMADAAKWWQSSTDPELGRLVEKSLTANLDIVAAQSRLAEADAFVRRARADQLPGGSVETSVTEQRQSLEGPIGSFARDVPGFLRDQTIFDAGAKASWEVDLFGRLGAATLGARANQAETAALLEGVRIRIAAETADAYVALAGANEQIAIVTAQRDISSQVVDTIKRRLAAGTATHTELDRAEGELARLEAFLPQARIAAEIQRNRLYVLTGGEELAASPISVPLIPAVVLLDSPAGVLRSRPDVRVAEARVRAADARIGSTLAEYYPSLSIGGVVGFQSIDAGRLITPSALNVQGLIGLRWRLFDFARIESEVAAARAGGDQALAAFRSSLLLATEDVENNLFTVVAREAQFRAAERAHSLIGKATLDARRTFEAGIIGLPAKLQFEQRLLEVEQASLDARLASARARIALFRATAGGTANLRVQE